MGKKIVILLVLLNVVGIIRVEQVQALGSDKLPRTIRVADKDGVPIIQSRSKSQILKVVGGNLDKHLVIKPLADVKKSPHELFVLAAEGKMLNSGAFGIGSSMTDIQRLWREPQIRGEFANRGMGAYAKKSVSFQYRKKNLKVQAITCHSFFGDPALPSISECKKQLGIPYKAYDLKEIIRESQKYGIDMIAHIRQKGIVKKTTNIEEAVRIGQLDVNVVLYKAGAYYFCVTELRIKKDRKVYRSVGVRVYDHVFADPWII